MEFRVGQIKAQCPACGGTDFHKPDDKYSGPQVNYACTRCRSVTSYSRLIAQIGKETMRLRKERTAVDAAAAAQKRPQARLR
ncbi:MAG TPA: hypothetical protein VFK84_09600 [Burkholderiales bacterium]|nr:hypothetical protein [Burkholderiales bacterium]